MIVRHSALHRLLMRLRPQVEARITELAKPWPGYVLFFSMSDGQQRAHVVSAAGSSFAAAWQLATDKAEDATAEAAVRWLRVDWVDAAEATSWSQLEKRLGACKRNYFRHGLALDAGFDHAFLETELNANAMLYGGPQIEHAVLNKGNFQRYANIRHGLKSVGLSGDDAVCLFSTTGVFASDDDEDVHRLGSAGPNAGRRVIERLTPAHTDTLIAGASHYLATQVGPDGRFAYGWHPCFDRPINTYNSLRHASSLYAMLEAWEVNRDPGLKAAIDRGIDYLCKTLIRPVDLAFGEPAAFLIEGNGEIKLGGNAVCLLALVKYSELTQSQDYLPLLEQLATGMLRMQDKTTGKFTHVLNYPSLSVKDEFRVIYYDGEAAFGLMRLYGLTRDARCLVAVERAFDYFIAARHFEAHDHWLSYCVNELTRHRPEERYFRFGILNVAGYLDFVLNRITTFPTLLELMMAAEQMIVRLQQMPEHSHLLDTLDLDKFYRALHARAHHLLNGHFWPELAMYFANPARISGSFFIRHHAFRVRIDDVEHYLSGFVAYRRLLQNHSEPQTALGIARTDLVKVAWGGDVNLGRRQHYRTAQLGPAATLAGITPLKQADLTIVNLECAIATRGEQGVDKGERAPYYYRARPEMLAVLTEAGIDIVATANNHSGDYGPGALMEQAALLDTAGIGHAGSGATTRDAFAPVIRHAAGLNIAVFSIDATQPRFAAREDTPGNAYLPLSEPGNWLRRMEPLIADARSKAHIVLMAVHWGPNGEDNPGADEVATGHALIDAGADAVLGASAHNLQGVEIYRDRPIVHDAGDLLFDAIGRTDSDSGVFTLEMDTDGVHLVVFHPIRVGFGQSRVIGGKAADAAIARFIARNKPFRTPFADYGAGQAVLRLRPPHRPMAILAPAKRTQYDLASIAPVAQPDPKWIAQQIPDDAVLVEPLPLGPLQLLGIRTHAKTLEQREILYVESFWRLLEPTALDWRIDIEAVPEGEPLGSWGRSQDHDPCDWMWPTRKWKAGTIYRDYYGLRPPASRQIQDARLQLRVGLKAPGAAVPPVTLPLYVSLTTAKRTIARSPAPQYRIFPAAALSPDIPLCPNQTWSAAQLAQVTGGKWLVQPPAGWHVRSIPHVRDAQRLGSYPAPRFFVATDFLTLAKHERLSQMTEKHWDTHARLPAIQPDLVGAIVARPVEGMNPCFPLLQVDDPLQAFMELGVAARQRLHGHVIAITGSAGKTSTARMLADAMRTARKVATTIANYNSRCGILYALANTPAATDLVVLELAVSAINAPGYQNIKLVRPTIAIITNICASHLQPGQTVFDVARRKANVFEGVAEGGWAVISADTECLDYLCMRARAKNLNILTYGVSEGADVHLSAYDGATGRSTVRLAGGGTYEYRMRANGVHVALNSLACIAVGQIIGLDIASLLPSLQGFVPLKGRGQVQEIRYRNKRLTIIDETYNANPLSMKMALASMGNARSSAGRKVLILGDMLELGDEEVAHHQALLPQIEAVQPDCVLLCGPLMMALPALFAAKSAPFQYRWYPDANVLADEIGQWLADGDRLLIKGSNSINLNRVVERLLSDMPVQQAG